MSNLLALQEANLLLAVIIAAGLFVGLLIPYLFEEIRRGKTELGPRIPTGAGDTHPGYRGNPTPGVPASRTPPHSTLTLESFHLVLIALSIVLASGTGVWWLLNQQVLFGVIALAMAFLLVAYGGYFVSREKNLE